MLSSHLRIAHGGVLLVLYAYVSNQGVEGLDCGATYVFKSIQVLVSFPADIALERLLFLHAHRTRVWSTGLWVDY